MIAQQLEQRIVLAAGVAVADYQFTNHGLNGQTELFSRDVHADSVASDITSPQALGSTGNGEPPRGLGLGSAFGETTEPTPATNNTDYFTFTITPVVGKPLSLSELSFSVRRNDPDSKNSFSIYFDEDPGAGGDNFATRLVSGVVVDEDVFETTVVSLEGMPEFTNLTTAVTFRYYAWGTAGVSTQRIDNVRVHSIVQNASSSAFAYYGDAGRLINPLDAQGNRVADFSSAGYKFGHQPVPDVAASIEAFRIVNVTPVAGDNTASLQAAIDSVAALVPDSNGFRGVVQLSAGEFRINDQLLILDSGIVLRGVGDDSDPSTNTILRGTGTQQRSLVVVGAASGSVSSTGSTRNIVDKYVPVGATSFRVNSTADWEVGDRILVRRPSTAEWISALGMDMIPPRSDGNPISQWQPGAHNHDYERVITHIDGNRVQVNAPLMSAFDQQYGGGTVFEYTFPRINQVGIENMRGVSDFASDTDEDHARSFIELQAVEDAWVANVTGEHFVYATVHASGRSMRVTVDKATSLDPKSVITGARRYPFVIDGQFILMQNLHSEEGRHDFVNNATQRNRGPNAFVNGTAVNSHSTVGPHQRFSTGTLYDTITTDFQTEARNRGNFGSGHGWAGANMVFWNNTATGYIIQNPPTAQNWIIGSLGSIIDETRFGPQPQATIGEHGTPIDFQDPANPLNSLYVAQRNQANSESDLQRREYVVGDFDLVEFDGLASDDAVYVDPVWNAQIAVIAGSSPVEAFDETTDGHFVPFSFQFPMDSGQQAESAVLTLGLRGTGGDTTDDVLRVDSLSDIRTFASLGLTTNLDTDTTVPLTIELTGNDLALLDDGLLNLAISQNAALDWANLDLRIGLKTDTMAPVVVAPEDIVVEGNVIGGAERTLPQIVSFLSGATATDESDPSPQVTSSALPAILPLGNTTVTFTGTDSAGNASNATAIITVQDTTAPALSVPVNVQVEATSPGGVPATAGAIATFLSSATATDAVDASPEIANNAPLTFPLGHTVVTFTATDDANNVATDSANVTIIDTTPPVIAVPENISVQANVPGGAESTLAAVQDFLGAATATDNGDANPVISVSSVPGILPLGDTVVTFTATDASTNSVQQTATISVTAAAPPVVTAPDSITVEGDITGGASSTLPAIVSFLASGTAIDPVDGALPVTVTAPGSYLRGTNPVAFTAVNSAGVMGLAWANVTVVDTTDPTFAPISGISVEAVDASGAPMSLTAITRFLDSVSASDIVDPTVTITHNAPNVFPLGNTTVTFTGTDSSGNDASITAVVTVEDTTAPTFSIPESIQVEATSPSGTPATVGAIATFLSSATATDAVDTSPEIAHDAPLTFPMGQTIVTFIATDNANNVATDSANVTIIDTTPPVLAVPANISVQANVPIGAESTLAAIQNFLGAATATDNGDANPAVSVGSVPAILPLGDTMVTFTATDASTNSVQKTATISVTAASPPVVTAPDSITVEGDITGGASPALPAIMNFLASGSAIDPADGTLSVTATPPDAFVLGTNSVTFAATNAAAVTTTATSNVLVVDTTPPALSVPTPLNLEASDASGILAAESAVAQWLLSATATDIVDAAPSVTHNAPQVLPVGTTTVTFTAADATGNEQTASVDVNVTIREAFDFGDAPDSFPVTLAENGARHRAGLLRLGENVSLEIDGVSSDDASGEGSGDDGVSPLATAVASDLRSTISSVLVSASADGKLDGWIDFDADGSWAATEQIFNGADIFAGANTLNYVVPAGAKAGNAAARFRLSTAGSLDVTGLAEDGEVEDYLFSLEAEASGSAGVISVAAGTTTIDRLASEIIVRREGVVLFQGSAQSLEAFHVAGSSEADTIVLSSAVGDFASDVRLDGGGGIDRLRIDGAGISLDVASLPAGAISGIEVFDIRGSGANELVLTENDVATLPDAGGMLRVIGDSNDTLNLADGEFAFEEPFVEEGLLFARAQSNSAVLEIGGLGWTNPINRLDVNSSGTVEPLDALQIVNQLNRKDFVRQGSNSQLVDAADLAAEFPLRFYDTSADGHVTPVDALRILNALSRGEGEAELAPFIASDSSQTDRAVEQSDRESAGLLPATRVQMLVMPNSSAFAQASASPSHTSGDTNAVEQDDREEDWSDLADQALRDWMLSNHESLRD